MTQFKKQLRGRGRIDFLRKMRHFRNVNIDLVETLCEYVIIHSEISMESLRVAKVWIVGMTQRRNKLILDMIHYFVMIDILAIMNICVMVWTSGFNMGYIPRIGICFFAYLIRNVLMFKDSHSVLKVNWIYNV